MDEETRAPLLEFVRAYAQAHQCEWRREGSGLTYSLWQGNGGKRLTISLEWRGKPGQWFLLVNGEDHEAATLPVLHRMLALSTLALCGF